MLPSEFFEAVPDVTPALLGLREVNIDDDERAEQVVNALVAAALVDYEGLTGSETPPSTPATPTERRQWQAYLGLLQAASLRFQKYQTALNAVKVHNPDVLQNVAFNLDLVRVIGRAERAALQRARKTLRGDGWVRELVTGHAQH